MNSPTITYSIADTCRLVHGTSIGCMSLLMHNDTISTDRKKYLVTSRRAAVNSTRGRRLPR